MLFNSFNEAYQYAGVVCILHDVKKRTMSKDDTKQLKMYNWMQRKNEGNNENQSNTIIIMIKRKNKIGIKLQFIKSVMH